MSLKQAQDSKTSSDSNQVINTNVTNSLIISAIDDAVTEAGLSGNYKVTLRFSIRIYNNIIELKQSDGSYLKLGELLTVINNSGYRHSFHLTGNNDRIKIDIAWD